MPADEFKVDDIDKVVEQARTGRLVHSPPGVTIEFREVRSRSIGEHYRSRWDLVMHVGNQEFVLGTSDQPIACHVDVGIDPINLGSDSVEFKAVRPTRLPTQKLSLPGVTLDPDAIASVSYALVRQMQG